MRRLLLILLMLIVPAQAALAAMCGYCEHRAEEGAAHVLVHGESSSRGMDASNEVPSDDFAEVNCALCHLGGASPIAWTGAALAAPLPGLPPSHRPSPYDPSHLDRIERVPLAAADSI